MGRKNLVALGTFCALAFCNSTAAGAPATTHYSTFLHSGPGEAYPVLDEVEHDTRLDVGSCHGGWCAVALGGKTGYLDRNALVLTDPAPGAAPQSSNGCFTTGASSTAGPDPRRFCASGKTAAAGRP